MSEQTLEVKSYTRERREEGLSLPKATVSQEQPSSQIGAVQKAVSQDSKLGGLAFSSAPLGVERTALQAEQGLERMTHRSLLSRLSLGTKKQIGSNQKLQNVPRKEVLPDGSPLTILDRLARFVERLIKRFVDAFLRAFERPLPVELPPKLAETNASELQLSGLEQQSELVLDDLRPRLAAPVINSGDNSSGSGDNDEDEDCLPSNGDSKRTPDESSSA